MNRFAMRLGEVMVATILVGACTESPTGRDAPTAATPPSPGERRGAPKTPPPTAADIAPATGSDVAGR